MDVAAGNCMSTCAKDYKDPKPMYHVDVEFIGTTDILITSYIT